MLDRVIFRHTATRAVFVAAATVLLSAALAPSAGAETRVLDPTFGQAGIVELEDAHGVWAVPAGDGGVLVANTAGEAGDRRVVVRRLSSAGVETNRWSEPVPVGAHLGVLASARRAGGGMWLVLQRDANVGHPELDVVGVDDSGAAVERRSLHVSVPDWAGWAARFSVTSAGAVQFSIRERLCRLTSDGTLDPGFGWAGCVTLAEPIDTWRTNVIAEPTELPDGRWLVLLTEIRDLRVYGQLVSVWVARLTHDGLGDQTFGWNARTHLVDSARLFGGGRMRLSPSPDGGTFLARSASVHAATGPAAGWIMRLGADGLPEPAFGGGIRPLPAGATDAQPLTLADGGVAVFTDVAVSDQLPFGQPTTPTVLVFTSGGEPDHEAAADGVVWADLPPGSELMEPVAQVDTNALVVVFRPSPMLVRLPLQVGADSDDDGKSAAPARSR